MKRQTARSDTGGSLIILVFRTRIIMNTDNCTCNDFNKAADYNDIRYYISEDYRFNRVKNAGWYIRSWAYDAAIARVEPFKCLSMVQ